LLDLDAFGGSPSKTGTATARPSGKSSGNSSGKSSGSEDGSSADLLDLDAFGPVSPLPTNDGGKSEIGKESEKGNKNTGLKNDNKVDGNKGSKEDKKKSLSDMTPQERFELAIKLRKTQGSSLTGGSNKLHPDMLKSIRLFVGAVMDNPGLLAEDDAGLLKLSKEYYYQQSKDNPKNPKYHFFSGYFHDISSEYEKAKEAYQKVVSLAPLKSRMAAVAKSKIRTINRNLEGEKLAHTAEQDKVKLQGHKQELTEIARGKHGSFTKAIEYADKAKDIYGEWVKSKEEGLLDDAIAYYRGAISVDSKQPGYHYGLALVFIEKAATGEIGYKSSAKKALEITLKLNPPVSMKESAQKLLDSVSK